MASRFSARRLVKPLAYGTGLAVAGTTVMYMAYRPRNVPGADTLAPKPPRRDENGIIIPPKFPYIKTRDEQIADLKKSSSAPSSETYDLLVIGGGATGTGIALDAATRGLKVAMVERDDFSSGTSSKSTKLVHGGVRYLEKAVWNLDYNQYQLVKEALRERKSFLYTAPHLSSWLPIMLPLQKWWQLPYFWAGTKFYDFLAGSEGIESSYFLPRSKALDAFPMLKKDNLVGALVYYDGQHNDSRMNVSLAMTATLYGATTVNHLEVTGLEKDASGKLTGARVRDLIADKDGQSRNGDFVVKAKGIINATGPFADAIQQMDEPGTRDIVAPSLGVHVVLPGYLSPQNMGLIDPSTSDGRVIFFLPWQGNTIAGTTDAPCAISQNPVAGEKDIQWILDEIRTYLTPDIDVQRSDILAAWSGIRPLVRDPKSKNTESLVRSHLVTVSDSGLLTCAGGKWTTYRQMAEDAVDEAIKAFKLQPKPVTYVPDISGVNGIDPTSKILNGTCQTHHIRLLGAHGFSTTLFINLIQHFGLDTDVAKHLAADYGDRAWDVAALASPTENTEHYPHRGQRLSTLYPFIDGEVRYAVRSEYAQTAVDVLARRTRLSFLNAQAALHALPKVIDIMGDELKWSEQRKEAEWKDSVTFLASMGLPTDLLQITREQVLKGEMATSNLAPAKGASKAVVPVRPSMEPVAEAHGPLP
ncbi:mitochondrial glycerol-3-phosphate dehydrogenase [Exophiala xenobiotica]|uniref:Glycerol-3-phosphate dehydrogenase n=1 Tax=Vermiconidia calcicola TaxID=1690605 RepID=A0AAV9QAW5_9PEZI|nr:mitochondrial glycerol-3-phosphate dehydrogenase [Exophiala xenobiotica]KAK5301608.1 mitochondrial glycerol-3-phosphate dehydrogenase [Exophiala xenobiotica]KAK5335128.1 mitochondrial glycerol-3-phosphate dehydrogenase [Exophiala xenobiotica]KAK5537745.1 mitochondrial glycerol-3-phosphate dehydrogenase [Vermiconidia calcicola]